MARKRKKGEQEIRILPDGRIALVAPDAALLKLAQDLAADRPDEKNATEKRKNHDGKQDTSGPSGCSEDGPAGPPAK